MKVVPLTQGKVALISDEDLAWATQWKWTAQKQTRKNRVTWYAIRNDYSGGGRAAKRQKLIRMHREIAARAGIPFSKLYDHRDGDTLNNQRSNLRPSTPAQNSQNQRKSPGCTSQFKGVCWTTTHGKWQAKITINKRGIHLGFFGQEHEAAAAYNAAAIQYFGEFALLNQLTP